MQGQQNNSVHTSALHQTDAIPRFGPDHAASSGFSPGFRAIPSARLASKAGNGNSPSFTAPAHLRSGRLGGSVRTAGQKLAADPQRRLLDQLMEELSMHQPYDPLAPLEPGPGTQQSEVSSATQLDLDEVIARYAIMTYNGLQSKAELLVTPQYPGLHSTIASCSLASAHVVRHHFSLCE